MGFKFVRREEIEPGKEFRYELFEIATGEFKGCYFIDFEEFEKMRLMKTYTPSIAYKEFKETRNGIITNSVTNPSILEEIARLHIIPDIKSSAIFRGIAPEDIDRQYHGENYE